jgi:NADPH-dependent glutamate synthase beta subunit-like oxidoreductase
MDVNQMLARKDAVVQQNNDGILYLFKKNKIAFFHGRGAFEASQDGLHVLKVTGAQDETLMAKQVIIATGSNARPLPGVPFDARAATVLHAAGRVLAAPGGAPVKGLYCAGWAKRGPTGLVGTNSPDSKATIELLLEDLRDGKTMSPTPQCETEAALRKNGIDFVTWSDWLRLDAHERSEGETRGKARHKEPSAEALMQAVRALRG